MAEDDSIFDEPASPAAAHEKEVKVEVVVTPAAPVESIKVDIKVEPTPDVTDLKAKAQMLTEKIFKKGHIVDPHIGGMTFRKKLIPKDIGKTKADVPAEVVSLGHKRLIKKSALAEIETIRGKAYSLVEQHSTESWIPHLRFMSKVSSEKVVATLKTLKADYFKAVDKFVEQYPALKDEHLKEFPQWAEALLPFYPSAAQVKASFHFEVSEYSVSMVTAEGELLSQAKMEIESGLMDKLDTFLKDTVKNTRQLFLQELQAVKAKIDAGEKVNAKTVKKIHDMIEVAESKDIAGDVEFIALLSDFKKKFTVDASKEKSFKDEVSGTLDKILETAGDEKNAEETVFKYKRSILV